MDWIDGFLIMLILAMIGGGITFYFKVMSFQYFFRIRNLTGTKTIISDDKGMIWKNEKGVEFIKLQKAKDIIPMPPSDAIDISKKGKYVVEAYKNSEGNYAYIKDKGLKEFFHPIETNQQIVLADQIIKAHSKVDDWKLYLPMYVGLGFVALIVIGGILFIGEPIKALQDFTTVAGNQVLEAKRIDQGILDTLISLENDIQVIRSNLNMTPIAQAPN